MRKIEAHQMATSTMVSVTPAEVTSGFRDPSFGHNRQLPLHRWVPWVAGFSAQFVSDCINTYLLRENRSNAWLLDPFSGVGTAPLEAYLKGLNVIGFEINPYAVLALRAKLEAAKLPIRNLADKIVGFQEFMNRMCSPSAPRFTCPESTPPTGFSGRTELFSPKVERQVLFALDFMKSISNKAVKDLFLLALGSVMISFSNYTYEPSLTRRSAVGKPAIEDADVGLVITKNFPRCLTTLWNIKKTFVR